MAPVAPTTAAVAFRSGISINSAACLMASTATATVYESPVVTGTAQTVRDGDARVAHHRGERAQTQNLRAELLRHPPGLDDLPVDPSLGQFHHLARREGTGDQPALDLATCGGGGDAFDFGQVNGGKNWEKNSIWRSLRTPPRKGYFRLTSRLTLIGWMMKAKESIDMTYQDSTSAPLASSPRG